MTPQQKANKLYNENKIKVISEDDYEIKFQITNINTTDINFIKRTWDIKCFNPMCCLFRGEREPRQICYHKLMVQRWLVDNYKKQNGSKRDK